MTSERVKVDNVRIILAIHASHMVDIEIVLESHIVKVRSRCFDIYVFGYSHSLN
jgi:hypothetical protein